jgi:preprotein translocase subunit YajC
MDVVAFLPLLIILGVFMWFASRRQKKAMQATVDLHESLRVDDRVHTTSGLEATIKGITDDSVELEIAPGVITTWMKLAIRDRIDPADEDDDDDDDYEDDDYEDEDDSADDHDSDNHDVYVDGVNVRSEASTAIEAPSDPDSKK